MRPTTADNSYTGKGGSKQGPECGLEHTWWTREAWLEELGETGPPDKQAA